MKNEIITVAALFAAQGLATGGVLSPALLEADILTVE
jgi:hypothetical protein